MAAAIRHYADLTAANCSYNNYLFTSPKFQFPYCNTLQQLPER